jgi:integrase
MLTDLQIRNMKPTGRQREIADRSDVSGLTLRINQAGTKTFFLAYRLPGTGKQARLRIGEYDPEHFPLCKARETGRFYRSLIDQGTDPRHHLAAEAKRRAREQEIAKRTEAERRANTFAAAVADYVAKFQVGKKQNRTWKETQRLLLVNCVEWRERPIADIARRDVHHLLDCIMQDGYGYSANRTYAALKTFFRWCASRDLIAADPMLGVERPFDGERARERAWSDEEVVAIWRAADTIGGNAGAALKVLILTGQRRDEVFHMTWNEVEEGGSTWRLATARSKAKREHVFPLSTLAQRVIEAQFHREDNCEYVFPTSRDRPMVNWTALKQRVQKLSGIEDFTFHGARHTFRTALDRFGFPPHVKDECLNHARRDVGGRHYSHYDYKTEQLEAFERWAGHVEQLVWGPKVSSLGCGRFDQITHVKRRG